MGQFRSGKVNLQPGGALAGNSAQVDGIGPGSQGDVVARSAVGVFAHGQAGRAVARGREVGVDNRLQRAFSVLRRKFVSPVAKVDVGIAYPAHDAQGVIAAGAGVIETNGRTVDLHVLGLVATRAAHGQGQGFRPSGFKSPRAFAGLNLRVSHKLGHFHAVARFAPGQLDL